MDHPPQKLLDLDRFLPYRLAVLAARVSRRLAREYADEFGIDIAEWRIIAHLAGGEVVSVRDIHARVNLEKPRVSRAVERLALRGLVDKTASAADGRLVELRLTGPGRALYEKIVPRALSLEARLLDVLTHREREILDRALSKLDGRIGAGL